MPDPAVPVAAPDVVELKSVESSLKLQGYYAHASTVMKAAAEITRLRDEVRDFRHAAGVANIAVDALRARVAELEAALREIRSKSGDQWSIDTADRALGDDHV